MESVQLHLALSELHKNFEQGQGTKPVKQRRNAHSPRLRCQKLAQSFGKIGSRWRCCFDPCALGSKGILRKATIQLAFLGEQMSYDRTLQKLFEARLALQEATILSRKERSPDHPDVSTAIMDMTIRLHNYTKHLERLHYESVRIFTPNARTTPIARTQSRT